MLSHRVESEILLTVLGAFPEPPVDLVRLAMTIGVSEIRRTAFRDGFTDFSFGAPVIYLNHEDSGSTRSRFILAHELGHVMLQMPRVLSLLRERGQIGLLRDEEELADRVAATILIPDNWIESLSRTRISLGQVRNLARLADVSMVTLISRMVSSEFDIALLQWRKAHSVWSVVDRPGVPPNLQGYVMPSIVGHQALEGLGREESDVVIDCRVSGQHLRIRGIAQRRGRHALQLIRPSRDIRIPRARNRPVSDADLFSACEEAAKHRDDWNATSPRHLASGRHRALNARAASY